MAHHFKVEAGTQVQLANQVTVVVPPHAVATMGGQPATGTAQLRIRELHTKGDWVRGGLSLMSEGQILSSSVVYHVELWAGDTPLTLRPEATITVHWPATEANAPLRLYAADEQTARMGQWQDEGLPEMDSIYDLSQDIWRQVRQVQLQRLGWLTLAYTEAFSGSRADVFAHLPEDYNGNNTLVCAVVSYPPSVVVLEQTSGHNKGTSFAARQLPLPQTVKLVAITYLGGGGFQLSVAQAPVQSPSSTLLLTPQSASVADIKALLSGL